MRKKITREMVNDYLQKGCHIHIREDDGKGNNRIAETIFVVEIPYHDVCDEIKLRVIRPDMAIEPENLVVASRTFLSPRDKPNRHISNEVIVGRIIRKIEEGRGLSVNGKHNKQKLLLTLSTQIDLCGDISSFQTWLDTGFPPRELDAKKIAVFWRPGFIKEAEERVKMYKDHVESAIRHSECVEE